MTDLDGRRRVFAEEIQTCAGLRTPGLVEALASVPRERYLRPGPWTIIGESDVGRAPRTTPDADPRHVYHDVAVAIDPARQLFNGAPSVVATAIDALGLEPGGRVLHVGAGLGYYSALIAATVGPSGRVIAIEVDEALAAEASRNLSAFPWVSARHGNGAGAVGETVDAVLVNAGVTHPRDEWLDALTPSGRMVLPITATFPQMGAIGKGPMVLVTRRPDDLFDAKVVGFVAIYSAIGLRDDAANEAIGTALQRVPMAALTHLRRDVHDPGAGCWLHAAGFCFSSGARAPGQPRVAVASRPEDQVQSQP